MSKEKIKTMDIYKDSKTQKAFVVFPRGTDIELAKKYANQYLKTAYGNLRVFECEHSVITEHEGLINIEREFIYPYPNSGSGFYTNNRVLAVCRAGGGIE